MNRPFQINATSGKFVNCPYKGFGRKLLCSNRFDDGAPRHALCISAIKKGGHKGCPYIYFYMGAASSAPKTLRKLRHQFIPLPIKSRQRNLINLIPVAFAYRNNGYCYGFIFNRVNQPVTRLP